MKIYISGPILGKPNLNKEAFKNAELYLQEIGLIPINPHEVGKNLNGKSFDSIEKEYAAYMKLDILELVNEAEAIYMLKDWEKSKGATVEYMIAKAINLKIYEEGEI